jgi:hypothetical protein
MAATVSSMTSGCSARYSAPSFASRSSSPMTQSPSVVPSKVTTLSTGAAARPGAPELGDLLVVLGEDDPALGVARMYAVSSALVDG